MERIGLLDTRMVRKNGNVKQGHTVNCMEACRNTRAGELELEYSCHSKEGNFLHR